MTTDSGRVAVHRNYIITSPKDGLPSPQAYLVEQEPNEGLRSHFHFNSQFQIFVSGAGTIGRHEARPFVVQYAQRQTGYGPIAAGAEGLAYLTLRPTTVSTGAQYLPESKEVLDFSLPKRQAVSSPMLPLAEGGAHERIMLAPTPEGLGAWFIQVPAGTSRPAPNLANGSGRFYVVVGGEWSTAQGILKPLSVAWTGAEEPAPELRAVNEGLAMIVVQFPKDAWTVVET